MPAAFPNRAEIEAGQLREIRSLFGRLIRTNSFYSRKLSAAGVSPDIESLDSFRRTIPFTTKQEIVDDQKNRPPFGTNLTFPIGRYTRFHQTSGTTGLPIRWLDTPESWNGMIDCWVEVLTAANVSIADRIFFAFSFGPFIGFWLAFEAAQRLGCLCIPGGGLTSTARLRLLIDNGATMLCCTPTYAAHLAEVAARENIDLRQSCVKTILVAGEGGGSVPQARARLEQSWNNARVFDHHGMTEVGPVTFECPERPGVLHVMESHHHAEVIDPATTKPVEDGQAGELVLTTLRRTGSPLLRYRTGDLVRFGRQGNDSGKSCACGRNTRTLEGGILGRVDDMIVVRGVNVFPSAVEDLILAHGGVAEYQVTVSQANSMTELSMRLEPAAGCADTEDLAKRLEKAFQDTFALRVSVTTVPAGTLPRFEMKAKRWVKPG
ncbi:MAG TPA: AMP-binding protein [Candidatus Nitrosotalea sp.]|nr:AMP-binding protein [Candidatus Nitrosotalea sp.]